jgi:hypothetical protein
LAIAAGRKGLVAERGYRLLVALELRLVAVEMQAAAVVLVAEKHVVLVVLVAETLERSVAPPWLSDACILLVVEGCNRVAAELVVRIQKASLGQNAGFAAVALVLGQNAGFAVAALVLEQNAGFAAAALVLELLESQLLVELLGLVVEGHSAHSETGVSSACCSFLSAP